MEEDLTKQFKEKEQEANSLRNQVDEVKNQLKDKEDAQKNLEANIKFMNNSTTLEIILRNQTYPKYKSRLVYNNKNNIKKEENNHEGLMKDED